MFIQLPSTDWPVCPTYTSPSSQRTLLTPTGLPVEVILRHSQHVCELFLAGVGTIFMLIFPSNQLSWHHEDCFQTKVATPSVVCPSTFHMRTSVQACGVIIPCSDDPHGSRISASIHSVSHTALVTVQTSVTGNTAAWRICTRSHILNALVTLHQNALGVRQWSSQRPDRLWGPSCGYFSRRTALLHNSSSRLWGPLKGLNIVLIVILMSGI